MRTTSQPRSKSIEQAKGAGPRRPAAALAAELREAQEIALGTVNTGMVVTMDIGNPGDIHPRNKQEVGRRLGLCALRGTYGRDVVSSGPVYRAMVVVGGEARVHFAGIDATPIVQIR